MPRSAEAAALLAPIGRQLERRGTKSSAGGAAQGGRHQNSILKQTRRHSPSTFAPLYLPAQRLLNHYSATLLLAHAQTTTHIYIGSKQEPPMSSKSNESQFPWDSCLEVTFLNKFFNVSSVHSGSFPLPDELSGIVVIT